MKRTRTFLLLAVLLPVLVLPPTRILADDPEGAYYVVRTLALADGTSVDQVVINGPPTPPPGYERPRAELPGSMSAAAVSVLSNMPAFDWSFGCSATSAAMIAGYYDRTGYANMYTGPTNGGVMPLDNSAWPDVLISGEVRHQCPLSATRNGLDGRAERGHVDDYWIQYGSSATDPFITNGWTEHTYADCTGDFMKTNQSSYSNSDGSTRFWFYTSGSAYPGYLMEIAGTHTTDGGYGVKLFYESRGYTVVDMFNQYIRGQGSIPSWGFTYDQYKAEIDAGRPVMIHLTGHTVVGVGYNDDVSDLVYLHDTWDYGTHTMTWGASYSGMQQRGVTIVRLAAPEAPEMDVQGSGQSIDDGDSSPSAGDDTDFGGVPAASGTVVHTFTVENTGSSALNLMGTPRVTVSGAHASDFEVTAQPGTPIASGGGTTTFSVRFDPSVAGLRTATISIANDDADEDPYDFAVQGTGQNTPPVADDDSYGTDWDTVLVVSAPGVLDGDSDADGDPLEAAKEGDPAVGTLALDSDGAFVYTPTIGYEGIVTFTYRANDGSDDSSLATVTITVSAGNHPPVIDEGDTVLVQMDEDGSPTPFGLTLSATDVEGAILTWSILTPPDNGSASASGTGLSKAIAYTPTQNYYGDDGFVVQVSDGALTDTIAVDVEISPVNDPPTVSAVPPQATTDDKPLALSITVDDVETDPGSLILSAESSNAALGLTIRFGGAGGDRTVNITTIGITGTSTVTLTVSDGTDSSGTSFLVTISEGTEWAVYLPVVVRDADLSAQSLDVLLPNPAMASMTVWAGTHSADSGKWGPDALGGGPG